PTGAGSVRGWALHRTVTTSCTAQPRKVALFRPVTIAPVATGRAAPRAQPWLAISTAKDCATMWHRGRGIHLIPRAGPMAAVAKPTCGAPAATGCFIASPPSEGGFAVVPGPTRPGHIAQFLL